MPITLINSEVRLTGPNLSEFTHNVEKLLPLKLLKLELQYLNLLWNAKATH